MPPRGERKASIRTCARSGRFGIVPWDAAPAPRRTETAGSSSCQSASRSRGRLKRDAFSDVSIIVSRDFEFHPPFVPFLGVTNPVLSSESADPENRPSFSVWRTSLATGRIEIFPSVGARRSKPTTTFVGRHAARRAATNPRGLSPPRRTTVGGRSGRFRTVHAPCRRSHRPPRPSAARPWRIFQGARGEVLALAAPRCPRPRAQSPLAGSARADLAIAARA